MSDTHAHNLNNAEVRLILSTLVQGCSRELATIVDTPLPHSGTKARTEYHKQMQYATALMWRYWRLASRLAADHKWLGPYMPYFQLLAA